MKVKRSNEALTEEKVRKDKEAIPEDRIEHEQLGRPEGLGGPEGPEGQKGLEGPEGLEGQKGQNQSGSPKVQKAKSNRFVRSYYYSYSSSGPDKEELEERVIIDNDKGRIKTRKNDQVEERDMTEQEIKDYDVNQSEIIDRSWSNLLSWTDSWTDPWTTYWFRPLTGLDHRDSCLILDHLVNDSWITVPIRIKRNIRSIVNIANNLSKRRNL